MSFPTFGWTLKREVVILFELYAGQTKLKTAVIVCVLSFFFFF